MSTKTTTISDPSLFSGSLDLFRTALGGYYTTEETEDGQIYSFTSADLQSPASEYFDRVFFDVENQTTADYSNMIPSFSFPVRIASNSEFLESDEEWRAYILGGVFGQQDYTTKMSSTTHEYLNIPYNMPYEKIESVFLDEEGITDVFEISYDYSQHLAEYEETVNNFETELYMPNYYILSDFYLHKDEDLTDTEKVYPSELVDFITFGGEYETPETLFAFNNSKIFYSVPQSEIDAFGDIRKLNTDLTITYLTSSKFSGPTSTETTSWAGSKQKTIFLDDEAITNLSDMEDYQDSLPYKIKISFPSKTTGDFVYNYEENEYDSKILFSLNEAFVRQQSIQSVDKDYQKSSDFLSSSDSGAITVQQVEGSDYREINYIEFLSYCRDQYTNNDDEAMFIGEHNLRRMAVLSENGVYRHVNTQGSLSALQYAVNFLNDPTNIGVNSWEDLFSQVNNYEETIAYRVEKIGGPGTGDGLTQNVIQNYWFINSFFDKADFEFFDSQVKVNSDYTYNIYAYVLAAGIKYEYSNLLLTRDLGCEDELSDSDTAYNYGVEFYDPFGTDGNRQDRLFDDSGGNTATGRGASPFVQFGTFGGPNTSTSNFEDSAGGTYGSDAQIYSNYQYLADFQISYEPFLKVIEVPLYSKTLRILDNPPNRLNVVPYQVLDNSQRIGFDLTYNTYSEESFPSTISEADEEYRDQYLTGKDLISNSLITERTVSKPAVIEVFRTTSKPMSIEDFDGNLYKTIDLTIDNERFYTKNAETCTDQINTNQKYYYLFRVRNKQGTPGYISEIYETELINDGGYKFALFNVILESELGQEKTINTKKEIKKIFQLKPKLNQIDFDTTDVDFEQNAASQTGNLKIGSAEDLIWDKTFKIRLTSKKTGKKVDLNITYKIKGNNAREFGSGPLTPRR